MSEEDDCLCPLGGIIRRGGEVVLADDGALVFTKGEALVAICTVMADQHDPP